nr:ribonuclease H-like domain-containing protein [Tanacetum cinerariifolium]
AEAVNTACYVQNRVLVAKSHNMTPYELLHGRSPSIGFMKPFGYLFTILNTLDHLGKFQGKANEGFLVGYSKGHILLLQINVDDIIFSATNKELCRSFEKLMKDKFQMSSMGELTFFLGLQGNPQLALQDKGVIDSGCSRHMIGNMSYLSDFEELNEGYVAFGGNPKGGKITCKGKIKTGKLDFDNVYFVKELKFNLFSVSQMCDKKNSVLFTDTECLVLSSDFKLPDKSQVLLRFPRENNIYNVNLKNIVPSEDLTCLFAKATLDESNLWHR